jgi:signal transduction histidine kinase
MLAGGISVVLAAAVTWALALRRRAKQRSEMLVKEIRARNDAELLAAERMRLAADLHDTLSQSLSGAAMQLEVAGAMEESPEDMERHLGLARRLIDRSREDLRRTVWDLDPSALSGRDLADALRKVGREMSEGAEVVVEEEGDLPALPERIRVHLFRASQEALGNALRHGNPTRVVVRISVEPTKVRMTVEDNGKGFDLATVPGPDEGHFGLRSLRERFARLSGECEISSGPGGTTVRVAIPLEERRNE